MGEIENMNLGVNSADNKVGELISADSMTVTELRETLKVGYRELEKGKVQEAKTAFAQFRERTTKEFK